MIKAVIIDDEENGRELTLNLLKLYCPEIDVLGIASSVQSGYACILQHISGYYKSIRGNTSRLRVSMG